MRGTDALRALGIVALAAIAVVSAGPGPARAAPDPAAVRMALTARGWSEADIDALLEANAAKLEGSEAPVDNPDPARDLIDDAHGGKTPPPAVPEAVSPDPVPAPEASAAPKEPGNPPRFGAAFFALPREAFAPALYGPVAPDYRLGPGDEIVLDVWGDTVFRHVETVSRQGTVLLPDVGQVALPGMTLARAREVVRDRLATVYSGLDKSPPTTFIDLTLGRLRTVRVFVAGDVERPGGYDLSAASTVFHALWHAGGPTETGSLREIRVVRGDEVVATLDLYRYLLEGRRTGDVRLEHDDTIFVPVRDKVVVARGEITRPARYELVAGEGLADLVRMAGGPTALTDVDRAQIERILPPARRIPHREDRVVLDAPLADVLAGEVRFDLEDLDTVSFSAVPADRRDWVAARGNVWRPSTYEFTPGMRVRDLVMAADSLRSDTFSDRALLRRTRPDRSKETITLDLDRVMAEDAAANLELMPRDEIVIFSRWDLADRETVSVFGAVRKPGVYELPETLSLLELVLEAGGFVESAYSVAVEVSRVEPGDSAAPRIAETFLVESGEAFPHAPGLVEFELQNHDNVFVRRIPYWELQRNVRIEGEVRFPGVYTLRSPTERLATVIERAGGLLEAAFPEGFRLDRTKGGVGSVSVDLRAALDDARSEDNLILVDGDLLRVPELPMTVAIAGAVNHPTSLIYRKGKGIGYYIENTGGFSDRARSRDVTIVYSTGRAAKVRRFRPDPPVEPGARILVPARPESEGTDWGEVIKDTTAILASLATTYLVVDRVAQ